MSMSAPMNPESAASRPLVTDCADGGSMRAVSRVKNAVSPINGPPGGLLTPSNSNPEPESVPPSPPNTTSTPMIYISTAFHHQYSSYSRLELGPPDFVIHSIPDTMVFYVHRKKLLGSLTCPGGSTTAFAGLIQKDTATANGNALVSVNDSAQIINTYLHIIYHISCIRHQPTLSTISLSLSALVRYGFSLSILINIDHPISAHLFSLASESSSNALSVYALAASHRLEDVAILVSSTTLSASLAAINDTQAEEMGAVYLRRLFKLHMDRKVALRCLMMFSPKGHSDTTKCTGQQLEAVLRAYALSAAYITWEGEPNADEAFISGGLTPLLGMVRCAMCKKGLKMHIAAVLEDWVRVKHTI